MDLSGQLCAMRSVVWRCNIQSRVNIKSCSSDQAGTSKSLEDGEMDSEARFMSNIQRFLFGFGHFYNDVCSGLWFTYLLVYFEKVLLFSPFAAGNVFLVGQVADAISTPLVGLESDRTNTPICCTRYGRRKTWHLVGTISVTISFPFIFTKCIGCSYGPVVTSQWVQLIYYIPFIVIFQFGWAAVQVAHLAMIPELTPANNERTVLNGIRYAFTVVASVVAFLLVFLFLSKDATFNQDVTPADAPGFGTAAYVSVGMGIVLSIIFHLFVPDKSSRIDDIRAAMKHKMTIGCIEEGGNAEVAVAEKTPRMEKNVKLAMGWKEWLKEPQFYEVGLIYMCVRLFNNVFMAYVPLYVLDVQQLDKEFIALVPMVVYLASFVLSTTFSSQRVTKICQRKPGVLIGIAFGIGTCVWALFKNLYYQIFGLAIGLGISSALLIVNALALMTDMIAKNTESSAFVFGAMSFFDKVSSGIAVQLIQLFEAQEKGTKGEADFYRYVISFFPGGALLIALIVLLVLWPQKLGVRRHEVTTTQEKF